MLPYSRVHFYELIFICIIRHFIIYITTTWSYFLFSYSAIRRYYSRHHRLMVLRFNAIKVIISTKAKPILIENKKIKLLRPYNHTFYKPYMTVELKLCFWIYKHLYLIFEIIVWLFLRVGCCASIGLLKAVPTLLQ